MQLFFLLKLKTQVIGVCTIWSCKIKPNSIFFCYFLFIIEFVKCFIKMDEEQWMCDSIMSEEVDMNVENEEDIGMKVEHVDCFDVSNLLLVP